MFNFVPLGKKNKAIRFYNRLARRGKKKRDRANTLELGKLYILKLPMVFSPVEKTSLLSTRLTDCISVGSMVMFLGRIDRVKIPKVRDHLIKVRCLYGEDRGWLYLQVEENEEFEPRFYFAAAR